MFEKSTYCNNCSTAISGNDPKFCSQCGSILGPSVVTKILSPKSIGHGLSEDQVKDLSAFGQYLFDFVQKYQISPNEIEAEELPSVSPGQLFSKIAYYASGSIRIEGVLHSYTTDEILISGKVEGALGYYKGKIPAEVNNQDSAFTTLKFFCEECDGDGCPNCAEEGELLFTAAWDDSGVEFERYEF